MQTLMYKENLLKILTKDNITDELKVEIYKALILVEICSILNDEITRSFLKK